MTQEERLRAIDRRKELYGLIINNPAAISDEEFAALDEHTQRLLLSHLNAYIAGIRGIIADRKGAAT